MTTKTNLRFLLALGNKKVIVLKDAETLSVYSDVSAEAEKHRLAVERISSAVSVK